ncbi:hypothetical protein BDB00DRAFT_870020 [Zychaea mexicana]|uniref:uncharacterized protein n=1 Tax=Zychaea mexicana TaxID=64656 RepID=UPI0022FE560F|nr:uncharacterized protein BDB00DRAFT_870020 [Zychaea mexicana]KAI9495799.1 hypothetical protein BDB00DRAFT_870020 [Zychaea mexicana]
MCNSNCHDGKHEHTNNFARHHNTAYPRSSPNSESNFGVGQWNMDPATYGIVPYTTRYQLPSVCSVWCFVATAIPYGTLSGDNTTTELHTDRLIHFLRTLSWPDYHSPPTHHSRYAPTLIACTMGGIWAAYWQLIFDDIPYTMASVKRNITKGFTRFHLANA